MTPTRQLHPEAPNLPVPLHQAHLRTAPEPTFSDGQLRRRPILDPLISDMALVGPRRTAAPWEIDVEIAEMALPKRSTETGLACREKLLMFAVLESGIRDLKSDSAVIRAEAQQWIAANNDGWPFSFLSICEALGMDPSAMRREVTRRLTQMIRLCRTGEKLRERYRVTGAV